MGSVAMIYVHIKFHKYWFRHSDVYGGGGGNIQTHRQDGDRISLILVFHNKKSGLKIGQEKEIGK
jgi:hypothetical protein